MKETVKLTERKLLDIVYEDSEEYQLIKEKEHSFDSEKGWVEVDITCKRASDGKKFFFSYIKGGQGNNWFSNTIMEEVPTKAKKVYKIGNIVTLGGKKFKLAKYE